MVGAYLDASVLVALVLGEPSSAVVDDWMTRFEAPLLVSDLAAAEVSSAVSVALRTGRETSSSAEQRLSEFDSWRDAAPAIALEIDPGDIRLADVLVRRFELKLKAPDAIHLATALRTGATLVTLDRALLRAAAALGVQAVAPGDPSSLEIT